MSDPLPPTPPQGKERHLGEDIFIILCIISLWPVILGWHGLIYKLMLWGALAGLLVIFFRRIKRLRQARDDLE